MIYISKRKYLTYEETKNKLSKNLLESLLKEKTYKEIADEINADKRIVSKLAQVEYKIPKNNKLISNIQNKNRIINISKEELENLYINERLSARKIAEIFNTVHAVIIKKLKDYSIEIRPFCHEYYYENRNYYIKNDKIIDSFGYILVKDENGNYIREHRYIMELYLGRKLRNKEIVHHIDLDKTNNNIDNLFLFNGHKYHNLYHKYIDNNEYISPDEYMLKFGNIIDEVYDFDFLFDLYINKKMSANAIHKYILDNYNFYLDRNSIVNILKRNNIYEIIEPTINQYDNRICINDI